MKILKIHRLKWKLHAIWRVLCDKGVVYGVDYGAGNSFSMDNEVKFFKCYFKYPVSINTHGRRANAIIPAGLHGATVVPYKIKSKK